jgi:hypothetical protein
MPSITCPSCGTGLKIKVELPPGKRIKCPRCETTFAPDGEPQPGAVPAGAVQSGLPRVPSSPPPPRRSRAEDEEEDEDEPIRRKKRKRKSRKGGNSVLVIILGIASGVLFVGGAVLVLISLLSKGGGGSDHEGLVKDSIRLMGELIAAMESVKDANSARAAADKLNRIADRLEEIGRKAKDLPKIGEAEEKRLKEKYEPEMLRLQGQLRNATMQADRNHGGEVSYLNAKRRLVQVALELQRIGRFGG